MRNNFAIKIKVLSLAALSFATGHAYPTLAEEEKLVYGEDYFYAGALVPTCEVDVIREQGGKRADVFTANAGAVVNASAQEKISEKGCIDKLKEYAGSVNVAFPSSLFNSAIIDRLKDMACAEIESMVSRALARQKLALSSPYGYVGVDLGITRGGGFTTEDTGNATAKLEEQLIRETRRVINTNGREAIKTLEHQAGVNELNRDASKFRREGEIDINESVRDGLDAL